MSTTELIPVTVTVSAPHAQKLNHGAAAALAFVHSFEITDDATYELGGAELIAIQTDAAKLDAQRRELTKPLDGAKTGIMELFKGPIDARLEAAKILKGKLLVYSQGVAREAAEARAATEAIAQRHRDEIEAQAAEMRAQGRAGEAAVQDQIKALIVAPATTVPAAAPKVAGVSVRTTIDFEVTDKAALMAHVAAHPELLDLFAVDTVKLRQLARALGMACKLPGVTVFEKSSVSASRK